jgi:hypothetical protein
VELVCLEPNRVPKNGPLLMLLLKFSPRLAGQASNVKSHNLKGNGVHSLSLTVTFIALANLEVWFRVMLAATLRRILYVPLRHVFHCISLSGTAQDVE